MVFLYFHGILVLFLFYYLPIPTTLTGAIVPGQQQLLRGPTILKTFSSLYIGYRNDFAYT